MTKQRLWQLKQAREGKCTQCGGVPVPGARLCNECGWKKRQHNRRWLGLGAPTSGSGRKPKYSPPA